MSADVELATVFDALTSEYRRRLLMKLLESNPQNDMSVLEDVRMEDQELEALRVKIFHTHLPKLEAAGFIHWNRDTHEVEKGKWFDEIRPLLELINANADELPADWP